MDAALKQELVAYLGGFVSDQRKGRMEQVLASRTHYLTVVLEDIYQPHNASAVLRSCECFGVQDVHIIENRNTYKVNSDVDMGASRWLNLIRYQETDACLAALKKRGYRLVAATPHKEDCTLDELEIDTRTAVLFGTEELGLSEGALARTDRFVQIPMFGFTESLNISVCAALILSELTRKLRAADLEWELTKAEKLELRLEWYRGSVRGAELLEKRFMTEREA